MLKQLRIQNIALVEQATLAFSPTLNILTGETGSGKSAILHGLSLAVGERSDIGMVRKGCDKGVIEALFEIDDSPIPELLAEGGIDHERGQELIVRREILASGKGRVFINHQLAQLAFLRKLGGSLMHRVGQHTSRSLFSLDYHRRVIDLYGGLLPLLRAFQASDHRERGLREEVDRLVRQEAERLREIAVCRREIEELDEANLQEGEEEELFAEYTTLTHANELSTHIHTIRQALSGERHPLLPLLNRQKQLLESLVPFDACLQEPLQSFQNALMELQEIAHTLQIYHSRLRSDPERLHEINRRLTLLNQLKRKYGATTEEIFSYHAHTNRRLQRLENAEVELEALQSELKTVELETKQLTNQLTSKRILAASQLEEALTTQLRSLNMPKAECIVRITQQERMREGEDRIELFLRPNVGEREVALREGASGGELSRVLLALHALLAGKEGKATLVFDEVDANIGGETATIVAEKLHAISRRHQVICITHFPQVALRADCHLRISKEEREGRTLTHVHELDAGSRQRELARMAGIRTSSQNLY